jgi:hypothetical protein
VQAATYHAHDIDSGGGMAKIPDVEKRDASARALAPSLSEEP